MSASLIQNQGGQQPFNPNDLVKITALEYFKEALIKEAYEACPELIKTAKEAGAEPREIQILIAEHLDWIQKGRGKQLLRFSRFKGEI